MKIVAITSCPNGIAHTYMAQEKLEQVAKEMGVDIKVETQGGVGAENVLTTQDIEEADGVIIAADKQVDLSRFVGKRLINENVREGIHNPRGLIQRIINQDAPIYQSETNYHSKDRGKSKSGIQMVYQHLMNGVSFMVPFIVVGGLLIAIALTLGGETTSKGLVIPDDSFWKSIENIGSLAFKFMVPILAGYIAVSIADKPGLVPGMIGGAIAADGSFYGSDAGAGFLGGIVAGFLAGYIAKWIKDIKVPKAMAPIMPIIIIPIISSVVVGLIFIFLIGAPISNIFEALTTWLKSMQGANIIILAMIIGAMIAFDMGGPVNKVAFLFGSALIAEGAIPFAAQDPLRIIPANIIGAMIASVIAAIGGVGDRVAHGGPIVAVLGGIDHVLWFIFAVIVGSLVTMTTVLLLKRNTPVIAVDAPAQHTQLHDTDITQHDTEVDNVDKTAKHSHLNKPSHVFDQQTMIITDHDMSRNEAIDMLIHKLKICRYVEHTSHLKNAILEREMESTTAIGMNVAIPHAKSDVVKQPIVAVMKNNHGVKWDSLDGSLPQLIFLIAVPNNSQDTHLKILQRLSKALMNDETRQSLINANSTTEIYNLLMKI
ncbi:PTS system%2C mannose-specific IIAB component [Staphylococcus aureus]|uniref:fructose-specific PTS transporter subunit EIIC n=1 Tax=Staphylococcus aureus TaxID=1280 RepID=UPI0007CA0567|nr:PTS fructose transporter subunit IIABC [Staphylococcus aureus]SBB48611.1 PTS system%2C mannose-specific IIAB component [Staphylococcus aureus]SBB76938.1 PTS system%2C mannose-specific IIAB component [Staphylococcus aureus]